jgi:hypothetical protein
MRDCYLRPSPLSTRTDPEDLVSKVTRRTLFADPPSVLQGTAGAPGAKLDDSCAHAGLDKIRDIFCGLFRERDRTNYCESKLPGAHLTLDFASANHFSHIATRAGALPNLPYPWQGGFHASGMWP